ncbi:unnamed protein product [Spirodela intermedia]|uniref:Uncharacterized protein n=1 Tax=Spirodela intermedia TaxID=51605 RepID=A0A7I8JQP8_SPIIN|nr:unnamed protein product [Spirodela intermedia]CAA6671913.1 unnamed protein product [Spirodela intermedia]
MRRRADYLRWVVYLQLATAAAHLAGAGAEESRHNSLAFPLNRLRQWREQQVGRSHGRELKLDLPTVAAGILCLASAAVSSAGGVGGGALFLPILNLVAGLDLKTATTFSAFMVTGGAASNVLYNAVFRSSTFGGGRPAIDYDIALLSEPAMLLGVTAGVVCHVVFPEWLVMLMFVSLLAWSSLKTCRAGVERGDGKEEALLVGVGGEGEEGLGGRGTPSWKKIGKLAAIWLAFLLLQSLRGDKASKSVTGIRQCGFGYWFITLSQFPLALLFTAWIFYENGYRQRRFTGVEEPLKEPAGARTTGAERLPKIIFPVAALLAGVLGGLFGIGGGLLMNPVTAATSSFMVLFSSSMSAVQYLMLGMQGKAQAAGLAAGCFVASLAGLVVVQRAVGRFGRASLIIFSVSTVMVCSMLSMACFGAIDVWGELAEGESMGFKPLCKAN